MNLQKGSDASTESFIDAYGMDIVGDDFTSSTTWSVRNKFFSESGQPLFALITLVPGSPTHPQGQLLDRHAGYGQTEFSAKILEWRGLIDSVQPAPPPPPAPALAARALQDAVFSFSLMGQAGQVYDIESSDNLIDWSPLAKATNRTGTVDFSDPGAEAARRRFYRTRQ